MAGFAPKSMFHFIGQEKAKKKIELVLQGALAAGRVPPHILLAGKPGMGKTTLARVIAEELDADFKSVMAPSIRSIKDLVKILASFEDNDQYKVLLIDEIHSLLPDVEEKMYTVLEDWYIEHDFGKGLKKYTTPKIMIIGATTKLGNVSKPLRDRFGLTVELEEYKWHEIGVLIGIAAEELGYEIESVAIIEIVKRSKMVPRIALNLLYRCIDNATTKNTKRITTEIVLETMEILDIDEYGLEERDYKYLICLAYYDRPVGIKSIASYLGVNTTTVEEVIEPWLIQMGLVIRGNRGREITEDGIKVLEKYLDKIEEDKNEENEHTEAY